MRCDAGRTCGITGSQATSYAVGWSANANAFGWISGGFSVTQTEMTGTAYNCNGNPGDRLCLWKNQGQTAYTVRNWISTPCQAASAVGNPYVMWSPNANNRRGYYYCVYGSCRARGDRWLDTNPNTPGGP